MGNREISGGLIMLKQEIDNIIIWLQQQVKTSCTQGLVVGISGGIDAAVTGALMKRACPEHALGIIIPIDSDPQDMQDARLVVESLNLASYEIDLTSEHKNIISKTETHLRTKFEHLNISTKMADANLRARLRMSAIYATANALNYLVVGTDNQAEYFTGYFTKFGDGACDILPLVEFTKTEVRAMAHILGIPEQIINKAPSAGLWSGQTDEAELGTTYTHIDAYLKGEIIPEQDLAIIERLHRNSTHKRELPVSYNRKS